jgi:site-specific DNA-methyltransferase (adenine-specific)/modification methylase
MAVTQHGKKYARKIANDETPEIAIATFKRVMSVLLPKTAENCDAYIFTSYQVLSPWLVMLDDFMGAHGFSRKALIVWEKDGPGMGDLEVTWGMASEFIPFYRKGNREKSTRRRNAVLHHPQVRPDKLIHPHEKPLPLLEDFILASTNKHDFIVDPFGGSCSLARAARRTSRSAVCIEYDEDNYELASKAFNEGDGAGFDFG